MAKARLRRRCQAPTLGGSGKRQAVGNTERQWPAKDGQPYPASQPFTMPAVPPLTQRMTFFPPYYIGRGIDASSEA